MDKACFQHDPAYGDFIGLNRRTAAYKVLRDKFNIPNYDGYQCEVASMLHKSFDKETSGGAGTLAKK